MPPRRHFKTWTQAGALIPDEGTEAPGRGGSRHYPAAEMDVAMMLGALAHKGDVGYSRLMTLPPSCAQSFARRKSLSFKGLEQARQVDSTSRHASQAVLLVTTRVSKFRSWCRDGFTSRQPRLTFNSLGPGIHLDGPSEGEADPIMFLHRGPDETWKLTSSGLLSGCQTRTAQISNGNRAGPGPAP